MAERHRIEGTRIKADAPGIARCLARQGVNLLRIHLYAVYRDTLIAEDGSLNPEALDKMEFFIAELKKNGVYIFMDWNDGMLFERLLGKPLPDGWVLDRDGRSLTDSRRVLDDLVAGTAALTPLGGIGEETAGYKGYGYSAVVEILSAALQQGCFMKQLLGLENGRKVPYRLGHFFLAVDIAAFTEPAAFKKTAGDILRALRASRRMPGAGRIYTAGEKEYGCLLDRAEHGIPLNAALQGEIRQMSAELNLAHDLFP